MSELATKDGTITIPTLWGIVSPFATRFLYADAAASAQNPAPGFPSASDVQLELSDNTEENCTSLRGAHPFSTVFPPGTGTGRESTGASAVPVEGTLQREEALDGSVANNAEVDTHDVHPSSVTEALTPTDISIVSAAPSLPPFFKDVAASNGAATAVSLTTGAGGEANTAEVVDNAQIHGVGYAGESVASKTGCGCIVM